ncbi:MAG: HlyD family efflux transporter periplasmic adaptor subunit [Dongiaceae bacterium]
MHESPRAIAVIAAIVLLIYVVWISGPYLRSIVVRDAAVTTWIASARTPIAGSIEYAPHAAGERIGADGRIVLITNSRVSNAELVRAQAELDRANADLVALSAQMDALEIIIAERDLAARTYAKTFSDDVVAEIANLGAQIEYHRAAMVLEQNEAARLASMRDSGASSQSEADAAAVAVIDRERALVASETALQRAEQRLAAASSGSFLGALDSGDTGDAQRSLDDAKILLEQARAQMGRLRSEIASQAVIVEAVTTAHERARTATIHAPEGAMVWSLLIGAGAEVQPGAIIATWVNCEVLLVDAPISDLTAGLLSPGDPAEVTLEGEVRVREGTVLFTRGATATLGHDDLAALAKGRDHGSGQAIIELAVDDADIAQCPIGRAAFVDFPGVGIIDMFIARLRL